MSQIQIPKIQCANFNCDSLLSEFETLRLKKRWTKYRLCRRCRCKGGVNTIRCAQCGKGISNHWTKLYCDGCYRLRAHMSHKNKYVPKARAPSKKGMLKKILEENNFMDMHDLSKKADMGIKNTRTHIWNLKSDGIKIHRGYYIKEQFEGEIGGGTFQHAVFVILGMNRIATLETLLKKTGLDEKKVTGAIRSMIQKGVKIKMAYSLEDGS